MEQTFSIRGLELPHPDSWMADGSVSYLLTCPSSGKLGVGTSHTSSASLLCLFSLTYWSFVDAVALTSVNYRQAVRLGDASLEFIALFERLKPSCAPFDAPLEHEDQKKWTGWI